MHEHSTEGHEVQYLYEDLYEIIIRLCFLEGDGMLMDDEAEFLNDIVSRLGDFNPDWMDVALPPVEDGDDFDNFGYMEGAD